MNASTIEPRPVRQPGLAYVKQCASCGVHGLNMAVDACIDVGRALLPHFHEVPAVSACASCGRPQCQECFSRGQCACNG